MKLASRVYFTGLFGFFSKSKNNCNVELKPLIITKTEIWSFHATLQSNILDDLLLISLEVVILTCLTLRVNSFNKA